MAMVMTMAMVIAIPIATATIITVTGIPIDNTMVTRVAIIIGDEIKGQGELPMSHWCSPFSVTFLVKRPCHWKLKQFLYIQKTVLLPS